MDSYWFNFNSISPNLSQLEAEEVFKQEGWHWQKKEKKGLFVTYQGEKPLSIKILNRLGGTIWVGQLIDTFLLKTKLNTKLIDLSRLLKKNSYHRFAVWYYRGNTYDFPQSLYFNQLLKIKTGYSYLNPKLPRVKPQAVKKNLILIIIEYKKSFYLLQLKWYYPWTTYMFKDKNKKFIQPTAGMLPHKVARIMVNLSLNTAPEKLQPDTFLLDPFAGSGTILIEALAMNIPVVGIEKQTDTFQGLEKNLTAFKNYFKIKANSKIYLGDATKAHHLVKEKIIAVASEPYLGPAFRTKTNRFQQKYLTTQQQPEKHLDSLYFNNLINRLSKLYYLWLKHQALILPPKTKVCFVLPLFHFHNKFYRLNLFDNEKLTEYTLYQGPYLIKSQRDLVVRRQVFILRRK